MRLLAQHPLAGLPTLALIAVVGMVCGVAGGLATCVYWGLWPAA